jgi:putative transcriptional regulator
MRFLQGQLLIAAPALLDPNFKQAVLLLVQHNDEGALGLILNRPTTTPIKKIWPQISESECKSEQHLQAGGPVQGPLLAMHTNPAWSEDEVFDGVYITSDREHLDHLLAKGEEPMRLYAGYAGWGGGQLEREIEEGAWLSANPTYDHIFQTHRNLWEKLIKQISGRKLLSTLKIKHVPSDPSMN